MAQTGNFSQDQVKNAVLLCSPSLNERKSANTERYVNHTVEKAFSMQGQGVTIPFNNQTQQKNERQR